MKTPERRHWPRSGVFIVNFEQTSHIFLAFSFLNLDKQILHGHWMNSSLFFTSQLKNNIGNYIVRVGTFILWETWPKITFLSLSKAYNSHIININIPVENHIVEFKIEGVYNFGMRLENHIVEFKIEGLYNFGMRLQHKIHRPLTGARQICIVLCFFHAVISVKIGV